MSDLSSNKIFVVLTAFRRTQFLNIQIKAIRDQTVKPDKIYIWYNNENHQNIEIDEYDEVVLINCFENLGVWARFSLALNFECDYIAFFDDDTIPGKKWFENCIQEDSIESGLFGTRGLRFLNKKRYIDYEEFGWNHPNESKVEVDIVGHAWFFRKDYINFFWEVPRPLQMVKNAGEDIHISYALQKKGIKTFVPKHPIDDLDYWGSEPKNAIKLGTDKNAISSNVESLFRFQKHFQAYVKSGFSIYNQRENIIERKIIILKGNWLRFYLKKKLENKKSIKKLIKKFIKMLDKIGITI